MKKASIRSPFRDLMMIWRVKPRLSIFEIRPVQALLAGLAAALAEELPATMEDLSALLWAFSELGTMARKEPKGTPSSKGSQKQDPPDGAS